jgi:hypothetical protein
VGYLSRIGSILITFADNRLHAVFQCPPLKHHTAAASQAFKPNIGTQADDLPFITAARMRFAQAHHIAQPKIL